MYHTVFLDERVSLSPSELNGIHSPDMIKDILSSKLKEKYERKCNANGYVKPGSLGILGRSMGIAENGRFTGNLLYDCKIQCDVLFPTGGSELNAQVLKVNKMGAYAHYDEAIRILLPRDLHIGKEEFDTLNEGDMIRVRIERSRFQANDPFIMAVGTLIDTAAVAEVEAVRDD